MWRNLVARLGIGSILVLLLATPASAAELISIPIDQVIFGREGDEILVASADVPDDLIGLSCEMFGETFNQDSVHDGNDLLIRLGDQTRVLADFEDERDITYTFSEIAELPERIDVFVRLGRDGVSSGGFLISIECEDVPATTSTTASTTTTTTTTTTVPVTTVPPPTVSPSTTPPTTTIDIEGPTTTIDISGSSTTSSSTTSSTTTIDIAGPTSTVVPPGNVTQENPPPGQLAVTGTGVAVLLSTGLGLLALGALLLAQGVRFRSRA